MGSINSLNRRRNLRQELQELEAAFVMENLAFFAQAYDIAARLGGPSLEAVKVWQRAHELLLAAREEFEQEFL